MFDPLFSLQGKRTLITGGAGSLGTLISKAFAERGADVTIQDLNQERLDEVRKAITTQSGKAFSIAADLSDPAECARVVSEANQLMGGLDIVINTAGINRRKPISEVTEDAKQSVNRTPNNKNDYIIIM